MNRRGNELSTAEWAVLALVAEQPTHGFAVAREMNADGAVGQVWSLSRPLVYRAIELLQGEGLIEERGIARATRGPQRTMLAATRRGRRQLARWLEEPVDHVRDVRSLLLLKLLFLHRRDADPGPLLEAQLAQMRPLAESLRLKIERADGFDAVLAIWRSEAAAATVRFLETALKSEERSRAAGRNRQAPGHDC